MRTFCSHCFQAYDVEEGLLNQNVQCSVCRKNFIVVDHDNAVAGQGQFETYCNHCWQRHIVPDKNYNGMITCFNCNKKIVAAKWEQCPACGVLNAEAATKCSCCGALLYSTGKDCNKKFVAAEWKPCPVCGVPNAEAATKCSCCGALLYSTGKECSSPGRSHMYPDKLELEYRPAWWKNILYIPFATVAIILGIIIMFIPILGYFPPILGAFAEICTIFLTLFFAYAAKTCNPILTRKHLFKLFYSSIRIHYFCFGWLCVTGWIAVFYIGLIGIISGFVGGVISCFILYHVFVRWEIIEHGEVGKCWLRGMVVGFVLLLLNMLSCIVS